MRSEFPAIDRAMAILRARLRSVQEAPSEDLLAEPQGRLHLLALAARDRLAEGRPPRSSSSRAETACSMRASGAGLQGQCFLALAHHARRRAALRTRLAVARSRLRECFHRRFSPETRWQCVLRKGKARLADLFREWKLKQRVVLALLAVAVLSGPIWNGVVMP